MFTELKGHIVDLVARRIYDGMVRIEGNRIASLTECEVDEHSPYILPGFIDSHVHIESSMMTPAEFAKLALSHGTIGAACDPHEIANVLGTDGIDLMIDLSKLVDFRFAFGMPSCVPSCSREIETSGFVIGSDKVSEYMKRDDIFFLAEMMNFPGVLGHDPEVMAKIAAALSEGKPVDGHGPGLIGKEREAYAAAGISTDHECDTMDSGRAAIANGMIVQIREGSAAKDYDVLSPLISEAPGQVVFCTDDCHLDDFVEGHIDRIVRRAIADGHDVMDVLTAACLTPIRHYGIPSGLLQPGDPADFIMITDLTPEFRLVGTYIDGKEVLGTMVNASSSESIEAKVEDMIRNRVINNFNASPISIEDIARTAEQKENIIVATDGSLFTMNEFGQIGPDVQKMVVLDRYTKGARPQVAYIKGFELKSGAIAQSIAHDCHNIVAVGADDNELVAVINKVIEMKGGIAVSDETVREALPLPVAGLMSTLPAHELASRCRKLDEVVTSAGCKFHSPFITLAFMCLPVIPQLKLTDKGLFDSQKFQFIR